jgi:1-aminocyclopropane-1-carboxylate deaminase/D-cysteine desulfhydrase-like pyridoxal-dependent ACC family enzyme
LSIKLNTPTPLEQYSFRGLEFLIKRDDLISKELSGNKARKVEYYLNNLPKNIDTIISYGSIQSNAMYSLSYFAKEMGLKFIYHANHMPNLLKENPEGNLKLALENSMQLIEGYDNIKKGENSIVIKEGIAQKEAYYGVKKLALELIEQVDKDKEYQVFLSSGTGATSLFLSKALKELNSNIKVYTTPCVGSKDYLIKQFKELEAKSNYYPTILDTKKRYHFGKLYREFYQIWLELQKELNIELELLYDPKSWLIILQNQELFSNLIYIHQGGLLGNITMKKRYQRKYGDLNENYKNKQ